MSHPTAETPRAYQDSPASSMSTLLRILKSAPQDLWLDTIRRAKPRVHDELVFWMLNQTECDFAVAAHAFYHSDPAHYLDDPRPLPPHPAPGQTFAQVLINWDKGYYRTHKLQLELRDVHPRTVAGLNQKSMARPRGSLPFAIPARFLDPWGGKPIALPPYLSPDDAIHLWPIYAALQLRVPDDPPGLPRQIAKARKAIGLFSFRTRRS